MLIVPLLRKVISGGQTGVDRAALEAAKAGGLQTGGWMPAGFKAMDGLHPEFADLYGMRETESDSYPARTAMNVRESDGTLMIYVHAFSAGEKLTRQCCQRTPRPRYEVPVVEGKPGFPAQAVADWIRDHGIEILNVAGNSEFSAPGIRGITLAYLEELFALAKQ